MKNKTKKIFAGVGLGLVGAMTLTGCTMSEEQQEALDKVVSKADQIIELVENQNKELTHAEAVRLYEYAKTRLLVNKDNVWDNMKMTIRIDSNEEGLSDYEGVRGEQHSYKFADGKRVAYGIMGAEGESEEIDGWFGEVINFTPVTLGESNGELGELTPITATTTYSYYVQTFSTSIISMVDINEENVLNCKVNDNGNYLITASVIAIEDPDAVEPVEIPMLIDMEISSDGYLISYTSDGSWQFHEDAENAKYISTTNVKYEYGVLTDAIVQSNIDAYIAQESANN